MPQRAEHHAKSAQDAAMKQADPTHDQIEQRARELWEGRGRPAGSAEDDWLEAERQLRAESSSPKLRERSGSVQA